MVAAAEIKSNKQKLFHKNIIEGVLYSTGINPRLESSRVSPVLFPVHCTSYYCTHSVVLRASKNSTTSHAIRIFVEFKLVKGLFVVHAFFLIKSTYRCSSSIITNQARTNRMNPSNQQSYNFLLGCTVGATN
jgi:hypothetical protein